MPERPDDGINATEVARIVGLRYPQRVYEIRYFRERAFKPEGARGWRWVRSDALLYRELTRVSPDARLDTAHASDRRQRGAA